MKKSPDCTDDEIVPYGKGQVFGIRREVVPMISISNPILTTDLQLESATTLNAVLYFCLDARTHPPPTYFHGTLPSVRGDGNVLYIYSVFLPVSQRPI